MVKMLRLNVQMEGAAFDDEFWEVQRLLRNATELLAGAGDSEGRLNEVYIPVLDVNGNSIGELTITDEVDE